MNENAFDEREALPSMQPDRNKDDNSQQYKRENAFLQDCVIRLTKELLELQKQSPPGENRKMIHSTIEIPPCMLDSAVMSPLFIAYDLRIEELSSFIEHQGTYYRTSKLQDYFSICLPIRRIF